MIQKNEYYEQKCFWDVDYFTLPEEKQKILTVAAAIPEGVHSVLDAGCGNGSLLNFLARNYSSSYRRLAGIDISKEALQHVTTEKYEGTLSAMPFRDNEFDLVVSTDVIEHLPYEEYPVVLQEMQRVTSRYLIIVVPHMENLEASLYCCPQCFCWYNAEYHVRAFTRDTMKTLFDQAVPEFIRPFGPEKHYPVFNDFTRLLHYRSHRYPPSYAVCPQCGYVHKEKETTNSFSSSSHQEGKRNINFLQFPKKIIKKIFYKEIRTERWIMGLYKKMHSS